MKKSIFITAIFIACILISGCSRKSFFENDLMCAKSLCGQWKSVSKITSEISITQSESNEQKTVGTVTVHMTNILSFSDTQTYTMEMNRIFDSFEPSENLELSEESFNDIKNMFTANLVIKGVFQADKDNLLISGKSVIEGDGNEISYEEYYTDHQDIGSQDILAKYRLEGKKLIISGNDSAEIVYTLVE